MTTEIRFGGYQGDASVHTRAGRVLAEALDEYSEGAARLVFAENITESGRKAADLLAMTEAGELDGCYFSTSYLTGRVPDLGVFDQHFAVPDRVRAYAILDGVIGERLKRRARRVPMAFRPQRLQSARGEFVLEERQGAFSLAVIHLLLVRRQVITPPLELQQTFDQWLGKAQADHPGRRADRHGIRRDIAGDHATRTDHRTVADTHAAADIAADADIGLVADPGVIDHAVDIRRAAVLCRAQARELRRTVGAGRQRGPREREGMVGEPVLRMLRRTEHRTFPDLRVAAEVDAIGAGLAGGVEEGERADRAVLQPVAEGIDRRFEIQPALNAGPWAQYQALRVEFRRSGVHWPGPIPCSPASAVAR